MVGSKLKNITFAYLWHESEFERYFDITNETKDLTELTTTKKNEYLRKFGLAWIQILFALLY